ncbi:MAG: hypothetical protein EOP53_01485 [Sphingobacteriales bacterium]|nr:MAG: hypothetical protein EOP53_01485 [Sphingobacteriales bacterium]
MILKTYSTSLILFLITCFFLASCKTTAQTKTTYNLVTDFGAVGDDKTNNYQAFKKAAEVLSGQRNKTLIIPKGQYYIADYKIMGGSKKNSITDINFIRINGLTILGNNSTVRVNGKFTRTPDYKQVGVPYDYSYSNTVSPFTFAGCKNVTLKDITLNGGADQMEKTGAMAEGISYGIMVLDHAEQVAENFYIMNVSTRLFATDGIYLASKGSNFRLENIFCNRNGRQGLSIVKGKNITVINSRFDSTGFTGKYGHHAPAAGIDIENEGNSEELDAVKILHCSFRHNMGFQLISTAHSGRVNIDSCYFEDMKKGYANGFNGVGIYSRNSEISNSIIYGMMQLETAGETYRGNIPLSIKNNIIYSGVGGLLSTGYQTPMNITGNILVMLPKPAAGEYFPFIRNSNADFSSNVIVMHEDKLTPQSNRITSLIQNIKKTDNNLWLLSGPDNKSLKRSSRSEKEYYIISYDGTKDRGRQYFPDNIKANVTKTPEKLFLNDIFIERLFQNKIFTSYDQYKFDKSLLKEAAVIRDLLIRKMK